MSEDEDEELFRLVSGDTAAICELMRQRHMDNRRRLAALGACIEALIQGCENATARHYLLCGLVTKVMEGVLLGHEEDAGCQGVAGAPGA
jgi:hypothetical protein